MSDSSPVEILASAAGQQPVEFLMRGLFEFGPGLFVLSFVIVLVLVAGLCREAVQEGRRDS